MLEVLQTVLGFGIDFAALEVRAEEMESVVRRLQSMGADEGGERTDDDLRYFD